MNYQIDASKKAPAYIQLYELLVQDIVKGAYPYQSKLPSKRVIAADTGVSVITVSHALELLCDEGYAESRERSGVFVIYKDTEFIGTRTEVSQPPALSSANGQGLRQDLLVHGPSEISFSVLSKTMRRVLLDYGDKILTRSPNLGSYELRKEIAAYLVRSRGMQVQAEQIVIGSGAEYLYGMIAQLLGGRSFALEAPCYEKITKVYQSMGIKCQQLPLAEDGISFESLAASSANALHVTPYHSYPSGITIAISKKQEYLSWAKARNAVIIEDNYDSELTVSSKLEDSLFALSKDQNVIFVNSFSHTIAPSMRTGYLVLPESMLEAYEARLGFYSCTVPLFEQYVIAELLSSGDFERHVNRIRRQKRKEMRKTREY